jgi:large subunit ribosomal protein L4
LQNFTIRLNKKEKVLALRSLLSKFAKEKDIVVIDGLNSIKPKTKEGLKMFTAFSEAKKELTTSKKIAIVTSRTLPGVKRAFGNLPKVNLLSLKSLNTYDLSRQNVLIFSRKAIEKLAK